MEAYRNVIAERCQTDPALLEENREKCHSIISSITDEAERIAYMHAYAGFFSDSEVYEELLQNVYDSSLGWENKLWLSNQISGDLFTKKECITHGISVLQYRLYKKIFDDFSGRYKAECGELQRMAPSKSNIVFVMVEQFLSMMHVPTKTTLDRAYILKKYLGKHVIIINTAELWGGGGKTFLFTEHTANYLDELSEIETVSYLDETFPFVQFGKYTPDIASADVLCSFVKKSKPEFIVNIGGESLMADLCAELVPVLNINTVPSHISRTMASKQVVGADVVLGADDIELLGLLGKSADDVMHGRFTWSLKEQTHVITREEIGLPHDAFALAVIGGRLTEEMSDEFAAMLNDILSEDIWLVIIGVMKSYDSFAAKYDDFGKYSIYLGIQDDVLAVLDNCDLYVNPPRVGGGTSVIEAMYKHLPAVTLSYGDVALGAGESFQAATLDEMKEKILKYAHDGEYYAEYAELAARRAEYMLDSRTAFCEIIEEFKKLCIHE